MIRPTVALLAFVVLTIPAAAQDLRVGVAAEVITPDLGAPLAGYYSPRAAKAVDDELYAKALVIEQDGVKAAMVVCDLLTLPRNLTDEARKLITASTGIPADHVMISATHTHTGPVVLRGSSQDPSGDDAAARSQAYAAALPERIARSVQSAHTKLAPAKAWAAVGRREGLSFNRRFLMKDGSVGWNAGKLNPNIVKPAGPIDPDVPVVYFESSDGNKPLATHVSFAMHLDTVGGGNISADYPATLTRLLGEAKGPDMLTLFATGACGDINHIDYQSADKQGGPDEAKKIGKALAETVVATYPALKPVSPGPLRAKSEAVPLPLAELKPGDFEAARDTVLNVGKAKVAFLDRVRAFKVLDVAARKGKPLDVEVQVIALGDVAWVSLPGEAFVELGLEIKKRSPFRQTVIVELANGSIGYIPTRRAYAEGNYEPTSARCGIGSGEMLVEAAVRLLNEVKSQK